MNPTIAKSPRRPPRIAGLFQDETATDSFWVRERGVLRLPPLDGIRALTVSGEMLPADPADPTSAVPPGLRIILDGKFAAGRPSLATGSFSFEIPLPQSRRQSTEHILELQLTGVGWTNTLAWLGRVTGAAPLQKWRSQSRNRRLRISRITAGEESLFDFSNRASPWNPAVTRRHLKIGMNIVGFLRADLGIGESARCMVRAADRAELPASLVELRLPCKNPMSDASFADRLQVANPHPVNVFHLDAPASRDIDHHHGPAFRNGRYNIGYWAWELPEFPDAWIQFADYFDEIWAPSQFSAHAIAEKVPVPVLPMPHSISFRMPSGDFRAKFGLPAGKFLFLFIYDLNSYSERKNPSAVIEAFSRSGLAGKGAALVIKLHNVRGNEADFDRVRNLAAGLPETTIIDRTLSRSEVYELESACDCFVSLHRSEGFGLAVAECMLLGKPVICTDWSATAEFVDAGNGCPVRATVTELERNHGPYAKGQKWAEPDIDHAADWMKKLFDDHSLGRRLGARARDTIAAKFSPEAIGARYRRRLESIASW